jgi:hypothetical protein
MNRQGFDYSHDKLYSYNDMFQKSCACIYVLMDMLVGMLMLMLILIGMLILILILILMRMDMLMDLLLLDALLIVMGMVSVRVSLLLFFIDFGFRCFSSETGMFFR